MSSINPPQSRQPGSTPASKDGPHDAHRRKSKEFRLPDQAKQKEEDKKKDMFALAQEVMLSQDKGQHLSSEIEQKIESADAIAPKDAAAQVQEIGRLITNMVETLHVGEVGGKSFAALNLKASPDVPAAFVGSSITLTQQPTGMVIHFDNFADMNQQNLAITLVEKNKEQLEEMIQALNAKNIQVAQLSLGEHVVTLPRVVPPQAPIQPISLASRTETQQQRQQQDEREGGRGDRENE